MTNEEAIVQLEIDATNLVGRLASEPVHDTSFSELWERKLEAIDIAIYAVKMFDKHEAECERCACNLLAERDALKEEKLISNADVAQVVRCGDCKHRIFVEVGDVGQIGGCEIFGCAMQNSSFCSYGEKEAT